MATPNSKPKTQNRPAKRGRPTLDPTGAARVVLPGQRVRPDTLEWLEQHPTGIGRAIDHAVTCARLVERQATATGILRPQKVSRL